MSSAHLPGPHASPERLHRLPSRLLARAAAHADRIVTAALASTSGRKWHYAVLVALDDLGPASQAVLSDRTGIYRSDMVAVLNELTDEGLVVRAPDPADRRRNVVALTSDGVARLGRLEAAVRAAQDELLEPLDEADRARLVDLLVRLDAHHAARPHGITGA